MSVGLDRLLLNVLYVPLLSDVSLGVLVIFAKLSDIFGRKLLLLVVVLIFAVFSGACGAAQSIEQLSVILRTW